MAAGSAIAKKIAEYLAKGQVKKAARLEADQAIRREIWDKYEQFTIQKLRNVGKPPLTTKEGIAEFEPIIVGSSERAIAAATQKLISRGYTVEEANNLADRLWVKANSEIGASLYNIHGEQPPPKIKRAGPAHPSVAGVPVLTRFPKSEGPRNELLIRQFPNAKPGDIVEYEGQLYLRTTATSAKGTVPNFLSLEPYAKHEYYP